MHKAGQFLDYEMDDFRQLMELNFFATVQTIRTFLPDMIEAGYGKIVSVASTAGKYGSLFQSPYNSSKHVRSWDSLVAWPGDRQAGRDRERHLSRVRRDRHDGPGVCRVAESFRGGRPREGTGDRSGPVPQGRFLHPEEIAHLAVPRVRRIGRYDWAGPHHLWWPDPCLRGGAMPTEIPDPRLTEVADNVFAYIHRTGPGS